MLPNSANRVKIIWRELPWVAERSLESNTAVVRRGYVNRVGGVRMPLGAALRATWGEAVLPSDITGEGGKGVAGLLCGAPRTMRLVAALGCAGLTFKAFSQAELRAVLVDRLGVSPAACTPAPLAYGLRKVRGQGVVRKVDGRHRYTPTDLCDRVAGYWTKLHPRLLTPTLDSLEATRRPVVAASAHPLDHAPTRLNASFDGLAELTGLKFAASDSEKVHDPSPFSIPSGDHAFANPSRG